MREIAAASDFDFVALEPRRPEKGAARKGAGARAERSKKAAPLRFAALWRYRTPAFGVLLLGGLLAAVAINALFLQHGRHPAPLFGATFKIAPPAPPPRPNALDGLLNEEIPQGALKPVDPAQEAAFAAPAAPETPAAEAPQPAPAPAAPPHGRGDMLGALIADDGVVTPEMRAASAARAVLGAQKALARLGLPVKADGDYGAATRRAVEAFQRANHLPVTGELNPRTRRLLSARSGLRVE
ncbi:peptidoglycan-binding domain-containing protein [Rhodoblastus sp.]|uniref:peptidoglycan-binding domain-containing protein n=1 Tax=Rhodoblastus sp. TaxID=1962975 RepID=UPI00261DAF1F|nr:peptidoglycan-binding domain-containing protein [Rhodoblastus sp.]